MVREVDLHGELQDHAFHTFAPTVGNCAASGCHAGLPDFDYHGVQTAITNKMDQLAVLLGYADADALFATFDDDNAAMEVWQREAAYALYFVHADGSRGVHNPQYATNLLDNAIDYATAMGGGLAAK
jgi:hypothetical protein